MATMTNIGTQSFGGTKVSPNKSLSSTGEFAMRSSGSLSQYDGVPRRQRENTFDEVREDQSKARLEAKVLFFLFFFPRKKLTLLLTNETDRL